ncbi:MAG: hypothetical protein ACE5MB_06305 [Anaerolineae bacterium]
MALTAELYEAIVRIVDDRIKEIRVTREDFNALQQAVFQLTEAQRRTEERLDHLAETVQTLAEAQRRTEERLEALALRVDQLAEAQRRTEERLEALALRVDQLAEAQRRTEERLDALAEAQRRTEERLDHLAETVQALAEAQRRTEEALRQLGRQVGALSDTIGFGLEDIARVVLPGYLERHLCIQVELDRHFLPALDLEIDLYGETQRDGQPVVVVGEVKSRIYRGEVEQFLRKLQKVKETIPGEIIPVMFGYLVHPSAKEVADREGILLIASYQK